MDTEAELNELIMFGERVRVYYVIRWRKSKFQYGNYLSTEQRKERNKQMCEWDVYLSTYENIWILIPGPFYRGFGKWHLNSNINYIISDIRRIRPIRSIFYEPLGPQFSFHRSTFRSDYYFLGRHEFT